MTYRLTLLFSSLSFIYKDYNTTFVLGLILHPIRSAMSAERGHFKEDVVGITNFQ